MSEFQPYSADASSKPRMARREFIRRSIALSGGAFVAMSSGTRVSVPRLSAANMPLMAATGLGNNGVGNGLDPQPPGDPPINDGPGTSPGDPGNQGGAN